MSGKSKGKNASKLKTTNADKDIPSNQNNNWQCNVCDKVIASDDVLALVCDGCDK